MEGKNPFFVGELDEFGAYKNHIRMSIVFLAGEINNFLVCGENGAGEYVLRIIVVVWSDVFSSEVFVNKFYKFSIA